MALAAAGGLDNLCTLVRLDPSKPAEVVAQLEGHGGYIACCRFAGETRLVSASGDASCILWDVPAKTAIHTFTGHEGDVMRFGESVLATVSAPARLVVAMMTTTNSRPFPRGRGRRSTAPSPLPALSTCQRVSPPTRRGALRLWQRRPACATVGRPHAQRLHARI